MKQLNFKYNILFMFCAILATPQMIISIGLSWLTKKIILRTDELKFGIIIIVD